MKSTFQNPSINPTLTVHAVCSEHRIGRARAQNWFPDPFPLSVILKLPLHKRSQTPVPRSPLPVPSFSNIRFKPRPNDRNMSTQHVATWWPNARNMLRPIMLRYVALICCDRLAGALHQHFVL